jgi:hypothetical protein
MTTSDRSSRAGRGIGRPFLAVVVAAVVVSRAGVAQTPAGSGVATYQVFALAQGTPQLCPGQGLVIRAGVNQLTTRIGGTGQVNVSRSMPNAQVWGTVADPSIGTLAPAGPVSIGATPSVWGGFQYSFIFTAKKIGQTTINFTGVFFPSLVGPQSNMVRASPAPPVTVQVACNYDISLYSTWRLPGDRILDVLGVVQSAKLVPNAIGRFSTTATMTSAAAWMGPCPGGSKIQHSQVTIYGDLGAVTGSLGMAPLTIKIRYAPVTSTTTEGCTGRSRTDQGQPDPLDLTVDQYGGVLTPSHVLNAYVKATGTTTVVVRRRTP